MKIQKFQKYEKSFKNNFFFNIEIFLYKYASVYNYPKVINA